MDSSSEVAYLFDKGVQNSQLRSRQVLVRIVYFCQGRCDIEHTGWLSAFSIAVNEEFTGVRRRIQPEG